MRLDAILTSFSGYANRTFAARYVRSSQGDQYQLPVYYRFCEQS